MSIEDLRAALDGEVPEGFEDADPGDLAGLADAIGDARHAHQIELAHAAEEALDHVPRLLRGPVRRIVGL